MIRKLLIRIAFVAAMLSPTGCAKDKMLVRTVPQHVDIDANILVYVHEYIKLFNADTQSVFFQYNLTAGFENLQDDDVAAVCWSFGKERREIGVDTHYWNEDTPIQRKFLVFHELTHCLCNRDHTWINTKYKELKDENINKFVSKNGYFDDDNCPMSIMHPRLLDTHCILDHEAYYLREMKFNCKP